MWAFFQGRFVSIILKGDNDIIQELKYIHNNPVKAEIVEKASEYKWSSYNVYLGGKDVFGLVDAEFVLQHFSSEKSKAELLYAEFVDNSVKKINSDIEADKYESSDRKVGIRPVDINRIVSKVADYFNICTADILLRGNKRHAIAKQMAAYLISLKSKLQYREIGQKFGICASAVGQNIRKATEFAILNREIFNQLNFAIEN